MDGRSQFYTGEDFIFASKYNGAEHFAESEPLSSGQLWKVFYELLLANRHLWGQP